MTTDEFLATLAERGFRVEFAGDGQPVLCGGFDRDENLLRVLMPMLRRHREEIIRCLAPPTPPPTRRIALADGTAIREWHGGRDYEILAEERAKRPGVALHMQAWNATAKRWETFASVEGEGNAGPT